MVCHGTVTVGLKAGVKGLRRCVGTAINAMGLRHSKVVQILDFVQSPGLSDKYAKAQHSRAM